MAMEQLISDAERFDLRRLEKDELILRDNPGRWVLLPIEFPTLWECYKKIERAFWTPEDFKWKQEFAQLTQAGIGRERLAVLLRLAVYYNTAHGFPSPTRPNRSQVSSPGGAQTEKPEISAEFSYLLFPDFLDLSCEFVEAIQTPEGRAYLGFQSMMENFHREVFTKWTEVLLLGSTAQTGVPSPADAKLDPYVNEALQDHSLLQKQHWIQTHLRGFHYIGKVKQLAGDLKEFAAQLIDVDTEREAVPMAEVLICFAVMKGLFFTGLNMIPVICAGIGPDSAFVESSKKVAVDMVLHGDFAAHLYSSLKRKFTLETLKAILVQAAELEYSFMDTLLSKFKVTFNRAEYGALLRFKCQRLLKVCGHTDDDDLTLMSSLPGESQGLPRDFEVPPLITFEHKGAFYVPPSEGDVMTSNATTGQFTTDEDF
eukprot:Protomagalhaensia_wolfi_Nauph_80__586@NODE_1331_length_1584_cov_335_383819_g1028_i0_p1_GENE_NODE_1331_length_1584_cov_335_383819_g1028_i0NODE_1331_length_1584_cov_335_383819_g1028_i0_p1_ORF_typecomplete_len427_score74_80Ribonuc_red_sm/PF00268_21/0_00029Ribonuc_red_sm/PF00268_21/2_9e20_NODE_1331_length_1584_cov_335_383819_g1028_i02561536